MMESWILIILVIIPGVWSGNWGVTFEDQCALKGTSIVMKCSYDYPYGHFVNNVGWSKAQYVSGRLRLFLLSKLASPRGHFRYVGNHRRNCDLEINNVQHSDEGNYYFSFVTTFNKWTSKTSAYLSVKELTTLVQPSTVTEGDDVSLTCVSGCPLHTTTVWFRDGRPVQKPVFQASREDAGKYYCAVLGQEMLRSASVPLNVQYAPEKVTLSVSPSGNVIKGSSVTFTCSSDANPPVAGSGYSLYKDRQFVSSGQNHIIFDIQSSHSGLYHCQAWNNISRRGVDLINSTEIHLDVHYHPMNISVSVDPPHVTEGSSVNLTCNSAANPVAENYTWYKRTDSPSSGSMLQVGSGQVLSLPSVEASHTGLYLCQARNSVGENNSTEVLLTMTGKEHGSHYIPILSAVGVVLFVLVLLLLWKKLRTRAEKKTVYDPALNGEGSSFSASEDQIDPVYANVHTFPPSVAAQDVASHSQRNSHCEYDDPTSSEVEVTYTAVTIKPRDPGPPHHINNNRAPQESWSKAGERDDSVIYATVAKSS
ncbi:B-cell receptor CD22 isoform X2 [Lates calcarifer]|uniref:B-cell receptor CD22 isoform X2 n=1 Tax=Lates calcarifer TaxID=8187 RepID=A0A4W6EC69_LATCA|nr:B-cell receptor CD22 isoform X2 [Lates calcarifer]